MTTIKALAPELLYKRCDPASLPFETTAELEAREDMIGQERAAEAMRFGVGMRREGYNLFVLGPAGLGKQTFLRRFLESEAAAGAPPSDWCYLYNFEQPHKPAALKLPAGRGANLREDMQQLVEELLSLIPATFESDEYRVRLEQIAEEYAGREAQAFRELGESAEKQGVALLHTPSGFALAPMQDGEVINPEEYEKLPDAEKERIGEVIAALQERLHKIIRQVPQWVRERREKVKKLNREFALYAVGHLMDELQERYRDLPEVLEYFETVRQDVIANLDEFRKPRETPAEFMGLPLERADGLRRYQVNVLIEHGESRGAPVVFEDHPAYQNLVGRIDHVVHLGALVTDFTQIKPGALHKANGGYLLLDVHKLLSQPFAWEALKRALFSREARADSLGHMLSLVSTVSLEPAPIPLDLKVVLFGERIFYYLLYQYDPDFRELFKVAVDFEETVGRSPDTHKLYAQLIGAVARREELLPFERAAVARVIEHSAYLVGDAEKLATHMQSLSDLMHESDHWARAAGRAAVSHGDVQQAIDAQIRRADRVSRKIQEEILRGTLVIETGGVRVGQVNGLSVFELGGFTFAQPTRITATARLGEGEVIDVEREVELGGAIHSKGVLILSSFLGARYAGSLPLSLSASLVFEQTYGAVEGDSASLAELCALLSVIAEIPVSQALAVTGSVDQYGQAQAIGAVNEKIAGFFDICQARGLTGEQGVLVPAANVKHLMLRRDVVEAAAAGRFHIYAVDNVDQAIEILTGVPAGMPDAEGKVPEGSVNYLVAARLLELSAIRQAYASASRGRRQKEKHD